MINASSFSIPHSIAPLVAVSLLELCIKGIKGGKKTCCVKPQAEDTGVVAKQADKTRQRCHCSRLDCPDVAPLFRRSFLLSAAT